MLISTKSIDFLQLSITWALIVKLANFHLSIAWALKVKLANVHMVHHKTHSKYEFRNVSIKHNSQLLIHKVFYDKQKWAQ